MCGTSLTETCTRGLRPPLAARNIKGYPCATIVEERVVGAFFHLDSYIIYTNTKGIRDIITLNKNGGRWGGGGLKDCTAQPVDEVN